MRYTYLRKLMILMLVVKGYLTHHEAQLCYNVSEDELHEWFSNYHKFGLIGLKARFKSIQ